jgi:anti-sigma factor ChrR (cupin superfamily)
MKCTQPGTVTDDDLVAYVVGEGSPAIAAHIQACPHCTEAAQSYARGEQRLRRVLDRFDCPSPDLLSAYQLDLLSPVERQQIAAHLVLCPRCADERRILQKFLADDFPPARVSVGILDRIVATLVPPPRQLVLTTRGAGDNASQTYRAGELTLTLRADYDRWQSRGVLTGLLVRETDAAGAPLAGEASLIPAEGTGSGYTTPVEETGFVFEDILPGTYRLELALTDRLIVVEDLKISR